MQGAQTGETNRDNGRLLQPSDVNSLKRINLIRRTFPPRSGSSICHAHPSPGRCKCLVDCVTFYCDAGRQTPEERRRPRSLALWNVKQRWQGCANQNRSDEPYAR